MRRLLTILTLTLCFAGIATAQDEPKGKLNVFIDYFSRTQSTPFIWAETVRSAVIEGISKTNRVNLIDVDANGALAIEKERREDGSTVAGEDINRMKVMTQEGANLLIQGIVNDVSIKESILSSGSKCYKSSISVTLKVIDPANGITTFTQTFKVPNMGEELILLCSDTDDQAVQQTAGLLVGRMKKFVEDAFPTEGKVLELDEVNGNKVKTLYVNLGKANGVAKGAKFEVRIKRTIGGKISLKEIGKIEIQDVENDDLSLCKVKDGAQEIYDAFKSGQELIIRSIK